MTKKSKKTRTAKKPLEAVQSKPRTKPTSQADVVQGKVFGDLTVTARLPGPYVECTCKCGGKSRVLVYNLLNGRTKTCGCSRTSFDRDFKPKSVVDGCKVVSNQGERAERRITLKCFCGKTFTRSGQYLSQMRKSGKVHCGCLKETVSRRKDHTGEVFGTLKVIGMADRDGRSACQCACIVCGTKLEVRTSSLVNKSTRSCGNRACLETLGEKK